MNEVRHRTIETNGIRMLVAEQGAGPLVVLCHGFPESLYSWRHQLCALAEAGFHAVAPDGAAMAAPMLPPKSKNTRCCMWSATWSACWMLWAKKPRRFRPRLGVPVAWHAVLLRPDRFRGVIGLSVPFLRRGSKRPTTMMPQDDDTTFYQLYFQRPGVAEAELERDPYVTIRAMLYGGSGEASRCRAPSEPVGMVPRKSGFLRGLTSPPSWLTVARNTECGGGLTSPA